MVQPYPGQTQMPESQPLSAPASVRRAVTAMYAGAALSLIALVVELLTLSTTKADVRQHSATMTASQVSSLGHALAAGWIVGGLIAAALWIFTALACRNGKGWARIMGTVFFAIATLDLAGYLITPLAAPVKIVVALVWLAGLAALVLLWQRSSTAFFKAAQS